MFFNQGNNKGVLCASARKKLKTNKLISYKHLIFILFKTAHRGLDYTKASPKQTFVVLSQKSMLRCGPKPLQRVMT